MFSFGEEFKRLWAEIPNVLTYFDCIQLSNMIDDARTGREITDRDEALLLVCLEEYKKARQIRRPETW